MENSNQMRTWLDDMKLDHPLVIAGPCSAETEEQVLKIAHQLKDTDVNYYRAGIWKPRTRPGMFEAGGALGVKWLQKVKAFPENFMIILKFVNVTTKGSYTQEILIKKGLVE